MQLRSGVAVVQAGSSSSDLLPSLGTSMCLGCSPLKKKKKKKGKKRNICTCLCKCSFNEYIEIHSCCWVCSSLLLNGVLLYE